MKCPQCQFENQDDAKFCNKCGARDDAATAIERGLALTDQAGTLVLIPQFLAERAELARLRGNDSCHLHYLREAHRLFVEMGATGYAQRLATELGI